MMLKNVAVHGIILPALIVKLRPQEAFLIDVSSQSQNVRPPPLGGT